MENAWSTMPDRIPGLLKQWGQYSRSTEQDDPWSMVAFGDRKDFLQVLRMVHFLRKCTMRKTCKRDAPHGGIQAMADRKWHKHLTPHQNKRAE